VPPARWPLAHLVRLARFNACTYVQVAPYRRSPLALAAAPVAAERAREPVAVAALALRDVAGDGAGAAPGGPEVLLPGGAGGAR
jgi:hypothetical protein